MGIQDKYLANRGARSGADLTGTDNSIDAACLYRRVYTPALAVDDLVAAGYTGSRSEDVQGRPFVASCSDGDFLLFVDTDGSTLKKL